MSTPDIFTPLPHGSHLVLGDDDRRGADVVALIPPPDEWHKAKVITDRGT